MPIRPENRARYAKDWPAVSASVRLRAGDRCEWTDGDRRCCAHQYAVGHWERGGSIWLWKPCAGAERPTWSHSEARQFAAETIVNIDECWHTPTVIVLTVGHLDHQPENCDPANLRAWCQRHHLAYDHQHHMANAQATRRARSGQADLFT